MRNWAFIAKMPPLQPSPASKMNLLIMEQRLRRYSQSATAEHSRITRGQTWPPKMAPNISREGPSASRTKDRSASPEDTGRWKDAVWAKDQTQIEPIVLSSSHDSRIESNSDEIEIWADAFEYQDQILQQPRLSQVSSDDEKENNCVINPENTEVKCSGNSVAQNAPGPKECFARLSRQYEELPLPPEHKAREQEEYFTLQNNPTVLSGKPPAVMYITNENQLNSLISLLRGPILSLDLEWKAWETKKNISLIQLSDAKTVLLIQICRFPKFPAKLKEIIESPKWIKAGVCIMAADMSRLRDVYNVHARGVCELSYFARLVDRQIHGPKNTYISLSNLSRHYLGSHLAKGPVRCSDWTQFPLSSEQRQYAAIDAYAGYLIFSQLERLRQLRPEFNNVWPPISDCDARPPRPQKFSTALLKTPKVAPRFDAALMKTLRAAASRKMPEKPVLGASSRDVN